MYVSKVETVKVILPNKYQHHVTKFNLKDGKKNGERGILVFFIIDPENPILSTKHVPIQQKNILFNALNGILLEDKG